MNGIITFIQNNFVHAGPIFLLAVFSVVIVLDRINALYFTYPMENSGAFFDKMRELVLKDKISEALSLCDRHEKKLVSQVMKEALLRAHQPDELIEQGLQITVSQLSEKLQKRTPYLGTVANIATLVGLFGTILGMIHAFQALSGASAQQKSALLSAGISTAMSSTLMGLALAIPCTFFFTFLSSKTNSILGEVERSAMRALDLVKQRCYSVETDGAHSKSSVAKGA
jgi:biopolymer transport protein ExbB/TolQ